MCLIPAVRRAVSLPLLAAGGIASGEAMAAVMMLGADGVQVGTRFALSCESSAHDDFKARCLGQPEGDTLLTLKSLSPTRLVKNGFFFQVDEAQKRGASPEELRLLLGKGRAKKGIFEGDLQEGKLEIGQIASTLTRVQPAAEIVAEMVTTSRTLLQSAGEKAVF